MVSMGVLSDDFATVDLREDYANLSLPKEAKRGKIQEIIITAKPMKRKDRTAEKRQPIPSGLAGTAPRRRAFRFGFPF